MTPCEVWKFGILQSMTQHMDNMGYMDDIDNMERYEIYLRKAAYIGKIA